jgi:hypothetical protein
MNLYKIDEAIYDILENGFSEDEETGEILFDESNLEELKMNRLDKWDNIASYIKSLKAEAEAMKAEEKNLSARRKAKESRVENLMSYMLHSMQNADQKKFETVRNKVSTRKSKQVVIEMEDLIPAQYITTKFVNTPAKTEISKALKAGEEVPGAKLEEKVNLVIK